ncbi:MAG: hypothetical protein K2K70_12850 [Lachnospiraceae bacterium]|nr:hypothetical protein [Lachnospiraceae bacterium]
MGLVEQYDWLLSKYPFLESYNANGIHRIVRDSLVQFISKCTNPAIWCYGKHTRMLMTDFMFEMKRVKFIIDENYGNKEESGFHIINSHQIQDSAIDGIIISSYQYKDEIKDILKRDYPNIKYLDLYEELENRGFVLDRSYYARSHPYDRYKKINQLKRKLDQGQDCENLYRNIISEYISIKDFQSAIDYTKKLSELNERPLYSELRNDLEKIYQLELSEISNISQDNVIMLCIDGLRRQDVLGECMPNTKRYLMRNTRFYEKAYAVSTSTFESLVPAYSENSDLRTKYYESNIIDAKSCRFFLEAVRQNRNIFFYTDSIQYIDAEEIKLICESQTATEKMWSFILDAEKEENGLFYIHVLYESHYSYPNPDTEEELIADGSNIMFDYLERNGGKIRTDYGKQHTDALKYLDRVLYPFLELIPCRLVLYADHGNILIPPETLPYDVEAAKYSYHEDLIRIPLAIKSPETVTGISNNLMTLMSINEIVCSLLRKEAFTEPNNEFIKIQRSEIYNPDFRFIYGKAGKQQELKAFEAFVFRDGRKLIVYSDGVIRICDHNDKLIQDQSVKDELWGKIKSYVTVTDCI